MMTDQEILLIGMMTEGIHTPFLSDRDLALENAHYVGTRPGSWARTSGPSPAASSTGARSRCSPRRSSCCAGSHGGLLKAIADGTFGNTSRPPTAAAASTAWSCGPEGYFNPASEILEDASAGRARDGMTAQPASGPTATPPAMAGCRSRSRCRCRSVPRTRRRSPKARPCSSRPRWGSTRRWWCTPRGWARIHVLHRVRPGLPAGRPVRGQDRQREFELSRRPR